MCFSATASFTASAILGGLGVVSLRAASGPREIPFAAIPFMFALQQFSEGIVWVALGHDAPHLGALAVQVYAFFAFVFWPAYVPWTTWLVEPGGPRRRLLMGTVVVGTGVAAWLMAALLLHPVVALPARHHLEYVGAPFLGAGTTALYLLASTASLLLSSRPGIRTFGVLVLASFALAYGFYATWFISVWCYFSGIVSVAVCLELMAKPRAMPGARGAGGFRAGAG